MTRRSRIVLLVFCSVAVVATVCCLVLPREPAYAGQSLSSWLRGFEGDTREARTQAAEAVQHIGTNGLPILVAMLRDPGPKNEAGWRRLLRNLLSKQSLITVNIPRPPNPRSQALAALDALGPVGKDAVPQVEKLLAETPPDPRALLVLARMGPSGVPPLTRALTNNERAIRFGARACLNAIEAKSELVYPQDPEADFLRRNCELNLAVLQAALLEYKRDHPEGMMLPTTEEGRIPYEGTE